MSATAMNPQDSQTGRGSAPNNTVELENTPLLKAEGGALSPDRFVAHGVTAPEYSRLAVSTVFFFPALGGMLFGYDIGATSAVLTQLESSTYSGVTWYNVVAGSSFLQGFITSSGVLGAVVGSLICFRVADVLGRRRELLVAAVLFATGALIMGVSGVSDWSAGVGITVLMCGRILYGLGCGFAMHGAPAYIGEMSPPSVRGVLVSLKEAMIVLGILLGYLMGYLLEDSEGGWRAVYASAAVPAAAMLVGMLGMPSSARWLVLRGRVEEARRSLRYVTPNISELAIAEIQASAEKAAGEDEGSGAAADGAGRRGGDGGGALAGLSALWGPTCRYALITGVGLVTLQQITGQPSVLYYANTIFDDVGLSSLASVLTGAFKLAATLAAVFTVDKHGRKKLLYLGCLLMLAALLVLWVAFMFDYVSSDDCNAETTEDECTDFSSKCSWDSSCSCSTSTTSSSSSSDSSCTCCGVAGLDLQKSTILVAMFLYIGGYQVGFGPVVWLIISEVFPLELRGKAISVAVVVNFSFNLLVTFLFPTELNVLGPAITFLCFAIIDVYALWFIKRVVPETKGLSLEQIEALFLQMGNRGRRSAWSRGRSGSSGGGSSSSAGHARRVSRSGGSNPSTRLI